MGGMPSGCASPGDSQPGSRGGTVRAGGVAVVALTAELDVETLAWVADSASDWREQGDALSDVVDVRGNGDDLELGCACRRGSDGAGCLSYGSRPGTGPSGYPLRPVMGRVHVLRCCSRVPWPRSAPPGVSGSAGQTHPPQHPSLRQQV